MDKVMEMDKVATALDALHRAVGDLVEVHRLWETGLRDIGDWHAAITAVREIELPAAPGDQKGPAGQPVPWLRALRSGTRQLDGWRD